MVISRYQKRLSGPLLDRIDIHVEVPRVPFQKLSDERRGEPSAAIRARVEAARARQSARFANVKDGQGAGLTTNADTPALAAAPQRRCRCAFGCGALLVDVFVGLAIAVALVTQACADAGGDDGRAATLGPLFVCDGAGVGGRFGQAGRRSGPVRARREWSCW
jgi:hypothetical protein